MRRLFITCAGSGFVLLNGLISCSQEKKTPDVYRANPPVVRSSNGTTGLKEWNSSRNKQLDLHDVLDFSDGNPTRVAVHADCETSGDHLYHDSDFTAAKELRIWQLLPEEILTSDLSQRKVSCGFELKLFNQAGSQHVFPIASVPLIEVSQSQVAITRDGGEMPALITASNTQAIRIRFQHSRPADAKLICQDVELKPLPFEQVLDLGHFNLSDPAVRSGRPAEILQTHSTQICRAQIFMNGNASALSKRIRLFWPPSPIAVSETPLSIESVYPDENAATFRHIYSGGPLALWAWTLTNPSPVNRYLKIPKQSIQHEVIALLAVQKVRVKILMSATRLELPPHPKLTEDAASITIVLRPHQSLTLKSTFQAATQSVKIANAASALIFQNYKPFSILEVVQDGAVVGEIKLQTPNRNLSFQPRWAASVDWMGFSDLGLAEWN